MSASHDLLSPLEQRLDDLLDAYRRLRNENRLLRDDVARLEGEKTALNTRIEVAGSRLQMLYDRLPPEAEA